MTELAVLGGIFLIALASAFVPLVSIELALIAATATGPSNAMMLGLITAAAGGQMVGKTSFFLGGRKVFAWCRGRREARPPRRFGELVSRAAQRRRVAAATVLVSATTGLPPFALVSSLAGGWRLRASTFVLVGFAGRAARFGSVLLAPGAIGWL